MPTENNRKKRINDHNSSESITTNATLIFDSTLFSDAVSLDGLVGEISDYDLVKDGKDSNNDDDALLHNLKLTENDGITHASSTDARLDLFQELEKTVKPGRLEKLLIDSWAIDPLQTLKIIFHARSIHNGKGERISFYRCCAYLAEIHPKTLLENLHLLIMPTSRHATKQQKQKKHHQEQEVQEERKDDENEAPDVILLTPTNAYTIGYWKDLLNLVTLASQPTSQLTVTSAMTTVPGHWEASHRESSLSTTHKKRRRCNVEDESDIVPLPSTSLQLQQKLTNDKFYNRLYYIIVHLFADQLHKDMQALKQVQEFKSQGKHEQAKEIAQHISSAAKWAPSQGKSYDRHTHMSTAIALRLFCSTSNKESEPWTHPNLVQACLTNYRKNCLAPLREHLEIVERPLSAKDWDKINYSRVPSLAMNTYKSVFNQVAPQQFRRYLMDVALGKASMSAAALSPATLVKQAFDHLNSNDDPQDEVMKTVLNSQWESLVKSIRDQGMEQGDDDDDEQAPKEHPLSSTLAICDVSGSMNFPVFSDMTCPMNTSIGLSLILAELVTEPFKNQVITFHTKPTIHKIVGQTFCDRVDNLSKADWGGSTDFVASMRLILQTAIQNEVPPEKMLKRVFVFSDMEFDAADNTGLDTHQEVIRKEYQKHGYDLPEMIYWNIAGGRTGMASKATTSQLAGTALVSGYSAALLKTFIEDGGNFDVTDDGFDVNDTLDHQTSKINPISVMLKAISHPSFENLKVYD